jgi:hypothetical protein
MEEGLIRLMNLILKVRQQFIFRLMMSLPLGKQLKKLVEPSWCQNQIFQTLVNLDCFETREATWLGYTGRFLVWDICNRHGILSEEIVQLCNAQ